MSDTTMTEAQRAEFLRKLGLNPNAPALTPDEPAKPKKDKKKDVVAAPEGVNPHTMPVKDIAFDETLLDEFPDLSGANFKAAADKVFAIYRSPGKDPERNPLLWRKVGEFIQQVKRSRKTGGFVKEKVKATEEERELANVLATHKITAADLADLLKDL